MKKTLIIALTVIFMICLTTVTMAAATFSGEIDVAIKGYNDVSNGYNLQNSYDYSFGKMILNGTLGDDLTGILSLKADDVMSGFSFDEASVTFTEDWGSLKLGYYGWNNNLKDIVDTWTLDIKSQTNISTAIKLTDNLNLGLDFALTGTSPEFPFLPNFDKPDISEIQTFYQEWIMGGYKNPFGLDLGYSGDTSGGDLLYFTYNDFCTAWGFNAWIKLGDFRPFVQYRYLRFDESFPDTSVDGNANNTIFGVTYEPADIPVYIRVEAALANSYDATFNVIEESIPVSHHMTFNNTPWGIRLGYKLSDGAKVEAQYRYSGFGLDLGDGENLSISGTEYYLKLICNF